MMKIGISKSGGLERARSPGSRNSGQSHHVEMVLASIFAKRCRSSKRKAPRPLDSEEMERNWHRWAAAELQCALSPTISGCPG